MLWGHSSGWPWLVTDHRLLASGVSTSPGGGRPKAHRSQAVGVSRLGSIGATRASAQSGRTKLCA